MLFKDKLVEYTGREVDVITVQGHKDTGTIDFCGEDFIEFTPSDGTPQYLVRVDALFAFSLASKNA